MTDDIAKADNDRDALYAGYKKAVEGFLAMPVTDMAQATKVLSQLIKDYKINTAGQLDKETGLLVNFITDLEGKFSAQVTTLGLTAFVTNLKEANERVRTLTLQRTNEKMGITVGALKTARTANDDAYRALVKMVNALALVFGEKDYTSFIDYVNTEITHYKREVLNQKSTSPSLRAAQQTTATSQVADQTRHQPAEAQRQAEDHLLLKETAATLGCNFIIQCCSLFAESSIE